MIIYAERHARQYVRWCSIPREVRRRFIQDVWNAGQAHRRTIEFNFPLGNNEWERRTYRVRLGVHLTKEQVRHVDIPELLQALRGP